MRQVTLLVSYLLGGRSTYYIKASYLCALTPFAYYKFSAGTAIFHFDIYIAYFNLYSMVQTLLDVRVHLAAMEQAIFEKGRLPTNCWLGVGSRYPIHKPED